MTHHHPLWQTRLLLGAALLFMATGVVSLLWVGFSSVALHYERALSDEERHAKQEVELHVARDKLFATARAGDSLHFYGQVSAGPNLLVSLPMVGTDDQECLDKWDVYDGVRCTQPRYVDLVPLSGRWLRFDRRTGAIFPKEIR